MKVSNNVLSHSGQFTFGSDKPVPRGSNKITARSLAITDPSAHVPGVPPS
ncbi:MAG: Uncharacterised protein [Acidimicrobiaceae bacterium]|nr:MAG: Uncharacterised protein [Acidimicrobiaceae bacterium]